MDITRFLPKDQYDAALNSSLPTAANPFATTSDISAHGFPEVLSNDNTTGPNDIIVNLDQVIKNPIIGGVEINLNATLFNDSGLPRTSLNGATNTPINLVGFAYTTPFDITSAYIVGDQLQVIDTQGNVNDGVHTITAISFNGANTEIQWAGMVSDTNSPYGDWAKQGDGTEFVIGTQNSRINDYADRFGITSDRERLNFSITGRGSIVSSTDDISIEAVDSDRVGWLMFDTVGFSRLGELKMYDNLLSDRTTINFGGSYPVGVGSSGSTFRQGIFGSIASGGSLIDVKTSNTNYSNQLGLNTGSDGELIIQHTPSATDYVATFKAESGTVAYLSDVSGGNTIYNSDDTLTSNRTVNMGAFNLNLNGNVGIGMTPNANRLAIDGNVQHGSIWFNNGLDRAYFGFGGSTDLRIFGVAPLNSDIARFDLLTGKSSFGIGVLQGITSTHATLTIGTSTTEKTALAFEQNTNVIGDFTDVEFRMTNNNGNTPHHYTTIRTRITDNVAAGNQASADLAFFTDTPLGTVTEKMTITGSGNVLVPLGDLETSLNSKGLVVLDRTNGLRYRIYTDGGIVNTELA